MTFHPRRFQNARLTASSSTTNFLAENGGLSKPPLIFPDSKFSDTPPGRENKHRSPESRRSRYQNIRLSYNLAGFLYPFYALAVTCFTFVRRHFLHICQNEDDEDKSPPSREPETTTSHQNNNKNTEEEPTFINHLSSTVSSSTFSSDDEEGDHDFVSGHSSQFFGTDLCGADLSCGTFHIDDYELPFVRLIDNVIYFTTLYCNNYPAFVQELSHSLRNWGCPSGRLVYKHNLNPKEKRPKIVREGIDFLKRRKLKKRMTRVYGDAHKRWVLRIALASRLLIFCMQLIIVNLPQFFKHKNDGFQFVPEDTYGKLLDPLVNCMFGGYINWDAHYFLHISVFGYTSENILAFFPLLPMLLYIPSRVLYFLLGSIISLSSIIIVVGVFLNSWLFVKCAENIYEITKLRVGASTQLITTACVMFCFNPASIFFSGLYTETLFAYLTSSVLLCLIRRQYGTSLIFAALSCLCRSNGILNVGFILALELSNELGNFRIHKFVGFVMRSMVQFMVAVAPFILFQIYSVKTFCDKEKIGKIYENPTDVPLHCLHDNWASFQSLPYFYIQKKYWNVGFLGYFQFKQIPNFVLAAPVLYILGNESWTTIKLTAFKILRTRNPQYIYELFLSVHGLFLTFFCLFYVHVQVSTRMIMAACPYLYVYLSASHEDEVEKFRNREVSLPFRSLGITLWFILYYFIGTIAFSLGLPWT